MSEERIEEIDRMIHELKVEKETLMNKEYVKINEALKSLIGLCFIGKDKNYYMITDIPRPPMTLIPSKTDYFRLPVYKIDIDSKKITFEDYHSSAWMSEDPYTAFLKEGNINIAYTSFKAMAARVVQEVFEKVEKEKKWNEYRRN